MRLYLRSDLLKAEPQGVKVKVFEGPTRQRASEKMSPHMRIRPTKMAETPRTMGGEYMRRVATAKQREPYKCEGEGRGFAGKGCGVTVHPGGMEHIEDTPGDPVPHRVMTALQEGAEYVKPTKRTTSAGEARTGHLVEHPPKLEVTSATRPERQKELGPPGHVRHLSGGRRLAGTNASVSAEHIDRKLCPDCYEKHTRKETLAVGRGVTPEIAKQKVQEGMAKWAAAKEKAGLKRSLAILGELLSKAKGDRWISEKIGYLMREEGKPQDQAIAIAYNMAGRSRKSKMKKSAIVFLGNELFDRTYPVFVQHGNRSKTSLFIRR